MTAEQQRKDAEKVIQEHLERNVATGAIAPHIPAEEAEGLLAKLRKHDVTVLASPIAHG